MADYVLDHHLDGERARLALMSQLLDPFHRREIQALGIGPGDRTIEVGCGNGSVSAWLADLVAPQGLAVALDLDLSLVERREAPTLELRQGDIVTEPIVGRFDLVTARAVLHHVSDADVAVRHLVDGLKPGGAILLIEPDFLPVTIAAPRAVQDFWAGWLAWSREEGIDYHIGRTLAPRLTALGLAEVGGVAETAVYRGGSPWATYWVDTVTELRPRLVQSGALDDGLVDAFLLACADPTWTTQTIAFTAVHARHP